MRIALLSYEYPPETGFGGIGIYTWYQARALVKLGHQVDVLAGSVERNHSGVEEHDGVRVHRLGDRHSGVIQSRVPLPWTRQRVRNAWIMYRGLRALARHHNYDVIEMPECGAEGALLNHLTRTPRVVRFHGPSRLIMAFYNAGLADSVLCPLAEQTAIRAATALSSCSRFLAREVRAKLGIRRPVSVIPNGLDLDLFDAADQIDCTTKFRLPRDRMRVLFCGRMEPRKGIHLCKEIAASVLTKHEVSFVFAGQDNYGYMSRSLLPYFRGKALRGSVHYLGRLGLMEVRSLVCQSDILLMPSLWENCPYVCLEAMAAGIAIVASNQGGMPELIRDGQNGLLARTNDANSFTTQLERLIEDSTLRRQLGEAARQAVEASFTDLQMARRSVEHYSRVLGSGSGTEPWENEG